MLFIADLVFEFFSSPLTDTEFGARSGPKSVELAPWGLPSVGSSPAIATKIRSVVLCFSTSVRGELDAPPTTLLMRAQCS